MGIYQGSWRQRGNSQVAWELTDFMSGLHSPNLILKHPCKGKIKGVIM